MENRILVTVYKENAVVWFPSGQTRNISCDHSYLGIWGINMQAEEVPIPSSITPPELGADSAIQSGQVIIPVGRVWVNASYFGDSNFKVCVKVKDNLTGIVSFIDATNYNANIALCNFVPTANFCPVVTNLSAGTPATTSATITWTPVAGSDSLQWVNNTSSTPPATGGAYLPATTNSQAVTGLTANTTYHFWIRTTCPGGTLSAWTSLTYTTHA